LRMPSRTNGLPYCLTLGQISGDCESTQRLWRRWPCPDNRRSFELRCHIRSSIRSRKALSRLWIEGLKPSCRGTETCTEAHESRDVPLLFHAFDPDTSRRDKNNLVTLDFTVIDLCVTLFAGHSSGARGGGQAPLLARPRRLTCPAWWSSPR